MLANWTKLSQMETDASVHIRGEHYNTILLVGFFSDNTLKIVKTVYD